MMSWLQPRRSSLPHYLKGVFAVAACTCKCRRRSAETKKLELQISNEMKLRTPQI